MAWRDEGDLPWQSDRPLTEETAAAILRARFPTVATTGLRHLGYGWEFDVFLTGDGWVFRFPRRAEWSERFRIESDVISLVEPILPDGVSVPRVELTAGPTLGFPYPFAGHRFIDGVAADAISDKVLRSFVRDIAGFLGALHSIPASSGRAIGLREMDANWEAGAHVWSRQVVQDAQRLRGMDPIVDRALLSLADEPSPSEYFRVPLQLIHADLMPDHVIVDPATGRLRGVIDWTDAMLGDPARDFVFLATWRGWRFVDEVLSHYPLQVDVDFRRRIRWMAGFLSVYWLDIASRTSRDVDRHLRSVRNVFESAP